MSEIQVIVVNEKDEELGVMEKLSAHKASVLHRAFSVVIWNEDGQMLIQRRALGKYHSPGQWSNACCGHPLPKEGSKSGAERRLTEEMGLSLKLDHCFTFRYEAEVGGGLIENEIDHVFQGISSETVKPNELEVMDYRYISHQALKKEIAQNPADFTPWFLLLLNEWELRNKS